MKKIGLLLAMLVVLITAKAQKFVIKDANAQVRTVSAFTGVRISSAIDLYLTQGDELGVAVSADNMAVRDRIKTEVKDGELRIWFDGQGWKDWRGSKNMKAYVSIKTIESLKASGACDVNLMGKIKAEHLSVDLSGASDMTGEVEVAKMDMDINGASDIRLKGTAERLAIRLNGASSAKGWDLTADYAEIDASGASSINLVVNKEMNVKASGASDIAYRGEGVIKEMKSSGASSISKK